MSERREETYRKHRIAAEATQTPAGWCWSYLVDGRVQRVSRVRLLPGAEAALLDALACARVRIDELERTGWRYSKVLRRAYGSAGCRLLTLDAFSDVTCDRHSA